LHPDPLSFPGRRLFELTPIETREESSALVEVHFLNLAGGFDSHRLSLMSAEPAAAPLSSTYVLDCSAPTSEGFFSLEDFREYLTKKMKVGGLRNKLAGKVEIKENTGDKKLEVVATVKYSKRAVRYYSRKFLKQVNLRDRFRLIATNKTTYEFRPYSVATAD
jgi:large subunit ribosomal protein L22e